MARPEKTEADYWKRLLDIRVERFAKLVKLDAPRWVLCSDFMLLMKSLAALCPDEFGALYAQSLQKSARISNGRCTLCGGPNEERAATGEDVCKSCMDQIRRDVEADDAAAAEGSDWSKN